MREIKFRAWDKKNKKLITPTGFEAHHFMMTWDGGYVYEMGRLKDYEMMQYTGLKDKNGKEIYDGDVMKFVNHEGGREVIGAVEWGTYKDGEYITELECWTVCSTPLYCLIKGTGVFYGRGENAKENSCEVIGNIYENPELLK